MPPGVLTLARLGLARVGYAADATLYKPLPRKGPRNRTSARSEARTVAPTLSTLLVTSLFKRAATREGRERNAAEPDIRGDYSDGSSENLSPQSLSDWYAPVAQHYAGEEIVATYAYRVSASGADQNMPFNLVRLRAGSFGREQEDTAASFWIHAIG